MGVAYIYLFPLVIWCGYEFIRKLLRTKKYSLTVYALISLALIPVINSGHYHRNFTMSGSVLGVSQEESAEYSNEEMDLPLFVSNLSRNPGTACTSLSNEQVGGERHPVFS